MPTTAVDLDLIETSLYAASGSVDPDDVNEIMRQIRQRARRSPQVDPSALRRRWPVRLTLPIIAALLVTIAGAALGSYLTGVDHGRADITGRACTLTVSEWNPADQADRTTLRTATQGDAWRAAVILTGHANVGVRCGGR